MQEIRIKQVPKTKSVLKVGKEKSIIAELDIKFNKLQKRMWKFLLNIDVEDVEE